MFGTDAVPDGIRDRSRSTGRWSLEILFAGSIGRTDLPGGDHGAT